MNFTVNPVPRVSVVIPAFNAADFIEEAIDSILAQTFQEFEIVVVNDNSTDGTAGVLERYASDSRVQTITLESNGGEAIATNTGIAAARGEYIARLDADDIAFPERLFYQVDVLDCNPWVTICGGQVIIFDHASRRELSRSSAWLSDGDIKSALLEGGGHFNTSTTMWRKSWFVERNIWWTPHLRSSRDHRFWIDAMLAGAGFANLERNLAWYRRHAKNISLDSSATREATRLNRDLVLQALYPKLTQDDRMVLAPVLDTQQYGSSHLQNGPALSRAIALLKQMPAEVESRFGENRAMLADFINHWAAIASARLDELTRAGNPA
ncbi:glycosyltransferase [Burkholderia sp. 4812]|nr:glycosyltransferase [Burkholderia sp. 4812]